MNKASIENAYVERRVNYLIEEMKTEFGGKELYLAETAIPNHISRSDIEKLKPILRKYAKDPHPWKACYRDNYKRFGPGAAALCAKLKDIIRGHTKWRGHPELDKGVSPKVALSATQREDVMKLLLGEAGLI